MDRTKFKTRQELFTTAFEGLRSQKWRRAVSVGGGCRYRTPQGDKCAIGHCIPDDKYDPIFDTELGSISTGYKSEYEESANYKAMRKAAGIRFADLGFAKSMQVTHDSASSNDPAELERKFREFGENHRLVVPA